MFLVHLFSFVPPFSVTRFYSIKLYFDWCCLKFFQYFWETLPNFLTQTCPTIWVPFLGLPSIEYDCFVHYWLPLDRKLSSSIWFIFLLTLALAANNKPSLFHSWFKFSRFHKLVYCFGPRHSHYRLSMNCHLKGVDYHHQKNC